MTDIFSTQFGRLSESVFKPSAVISNPHFQTIAPKYFINTPKCAMTQERVSTPDGDFVDLDWLVPKQSKALIVLFHGLEGSSQSHYIQHLINACSEQQYACVVMHFRGCSGETNLTPLAYHSGAIFDPQYIIPIVHKRYPRLPLFTVGFSLGGNMLLKLLAAQQALPITAAVAVSSPLHLAASSNAINVGFSRFYQWHLMKSMKANLLRKMAKVDMRDAIEVNRSQIKAMTTFREFDDKITARLHGFKGADDYYTQSSALHDLPLIDTPTLIIHALDDPFMDEQVVPNVKLINNNVAYEWSHKGGHVGFLSRIQGQQKLFLPARITCFIGEHL